jgi:hypothetical protein
MMNALLSLTPVLCAGSNISFNEFAYGVYSQYIWNMYRPSDYGLSFGFDLWLSVMGIEGVAFHDENKNGDFDDGEGIFTGVDVELWQDGVSVPAASAVTNQYGRYEFADVPAGGGYYLRVSTPEDYAITPVTGPQDSANKFKTNGSTDEFLVELDESYHFNAGFVKKTQPGPDPYDPDSGTGPLTISKVLLSDIAGTKSDSFTFTISLTDKDGLPLKASYSYTGANGALNGNITNGSGTIFLKGGETVTLTNLPVGTRYAVTEAEANQNGYETTESGVSGVIAATGAAAVFTNKKMAPQLFSADHYGYIIGYPDGTVRPQNNVTRAETATVFFRMLLDEVRAANWTKLNPYPDVPEETWYNNAISVINHMDIVQGYSDGTFRPNSGITRGELAAVTARFAKQLMMTPTNDHSFSDISGHWAEEDILYAASVGWVKGYPDNTYKPDQYITRAEFMTLVNRVLERAPEMKEDLLEEEMIQWPDNADPDIWYYLDVQEATNSHLYHRKGALVPTLPFEYEKWDSLLGVRDWAALEKIWSTANS